MKSYLAYGKHSVEGIISNPKRKVLNIWAADKYKDNKILSAHKVTWVGRDFFEKKFDQGIPHQGIACEVQPKQQPSFNEFLKNYNEDKGAIVFLDQVTDPHNIGAIIRSAVAFGASAVVVPKNNAPYESAVMLKSASQGFEHIPYITVTNLNRSVEEAKEFGFWAIGLDGYAKQSIKDIPNYDRVSIIMGSEGKGMRSKISENCDILAKLPISDKVESLNVSNACAVALYELAH